MATAFWSHVPLALRRAGRIAVILWSQDDPQANEHADSGDHGQHQAGEERRADGKGRGVRGRFQGNWMGFAQMTLDAFLSPIAEELFFRGAVASADAGSLRTGPTSSRTEPCSPCTTPSTLSMPAAFLDGAVNQAFPTRRLRSSWMVLITHTAPSFLTVGAVLTPVL
jgi:hypothetical protein